MKLPTILSILILSTTLLAQMPEAGAYRGKLVGQEPYVNGEYGFSLTPPPGSKTFDTANIITGFLASFTCAVPKCAVPGTFGILAIKPLNASKADVIKTFQQESAQEIISRRLTENFPTDGQITVVSKGYADYNGRPAIRMDYELVAKDGKKISGLLIAMFVEEKKLLIAFASISDDAQSKEWKQISEASVRSFSLAAVQLGATGNTAKEDQTIRTMPLDPDKKILNYIAKSLARPEYPPAARAVHATGVVLVQISVDQEGNVSSAKAISGHPLLQSASVDAARKAKFNPSDVTGGKLTGVLIFNFAMPGYH